MKSIDQYYALMCSELEALAKAASTEAARMRASEQKHPHERPVPCGLSDMQTTLNTAQRMLTRFNMLCELGIENVSGSFPNISTTPLPPTTRKTRGPSGTL